jgi:FMN phosphatase YigB (HAD superfamily)
MKKTIPQSILNIIFDLGGVLLDLDFAAPVAAFQKMGAVGEHFVYNLVINDPKFLHIEMGLISPDEFRDHIRKKLGNKELTDAVIDSAWCSLLGSVPSEKVTLLKNLSSEYRLFLYSNTNAIHIEYFKNRFLLEHHFCFESLFEKTFYSHVIHDRKPQPSGFEKVIKMAGILPEETLFVDDFIQNIEAAKKFGLQVFHYLPDTDLGKALHTKLGSLHRSPDVNLEAF